VQSVALSKKDSLFKDAMETCAQSGDHKLAEELLHFFVEKVHLRNIQGTSKEHSENIYGTFKEHLGNIMRDHKLVKKLLLFFAEKVRVLPMVHRNKGNMDNFYRIFSISCAWYALFKATRFMDRHDSGFVAFRTAGKREIRSGDGP
jgi:hypothetical protein